MSEHLHDPGGKVRLKLKSEATGDAVFSACGRYRRLLTRKWETCTVPGSVLWIGMNPSTAAADVDDPTVFKEGKYTRRWGYGEYVKCNVMDYRATHPKMLLEDGVVPCSPDNLPTIIEEAKRASIVVLAYGALHKKLLVHGENVKLALAHAGIPLYALALTKDGHPRHPLYLKDSSDLIPFKVPAAPL